MPGPDSRLLPIEPSLPPMLPKTVVKVVPVGGIMDMIRVCIKQFIRHGRLVTGQIGTTIGVTMSREVSSSSASRNERSLLFRSNGSYMHGARRLGHFTARLFWHFAWSTRNPKARPATLPLQAWEEAVGRAIVL
jgi:hypothetical protein